MILGGGRRLCACGCDGLAPLAGKTISRRGIRRGQPLNFIRGHALRTLRPEEYARWRGGVTIGGGGYRLIKDLRHARANAYGYVLEHIAIAEKALGKPLPPRAVVHHVDRNRQSNANRNLVICEDQGYHRLLHRRLRALQECGHADWLRCVFCADYESPSRLTLIPRSGRPTPRAYHRSCNAAAQREWRASPRASRVSRTANQAPIEVPEAGV